MSVLGMVSCDDSRTYDHFRSVDVRGWDRDDSLHFDAGKQHAGVCQLNIGFRATSAYPYKDVAFGIKWTVYQPVKMSHGKVVTYSQGKTYTRKIKCNVYDDDGRMLGNNGISSNDYLYKVGELSLHEGDSIAFTVYHDMNLAVIPGITDVGLQLSLSD